MEVQTVVCNLVVGGHSSIHTHRMLRGLGVTTDFGAFGAT